MFLISFASFAICYSLMLPLAPQSIAPHISRQGKARLAPTPQIRMFKKINVFIIFDTIFECRGKACLALKDAMVTVFATKYTRKGSGKRQRRLELGKGFSLFNNSCCRYLSSLSCWSISSKGCFDIAPSYFCKFTGTSKALIMLKSFKLSNWRKSSSTLQSSIFRVTVVINKNIEKFASKVTL